MGSDHPVIVPYGTVFYDSEKKPFVIGVGSEGHWQALLSILEVSNDQSLDKWATNKLRVQDRENVKTFLYPLFEKQKRDGWKQKFAEKNIPFAFVNRMDEVFEQKAAQRMLIGEEKKHISQIGWDEPNRVSDDVLPLPPKKPGVDNDYLVELLSRRD